MKKIKINGLIFLFLCLVFLPLSVNATQNEITLKMNKTDLTVGDEITLTASLPEGFETYAMVATLKYDNNVFQKIDESNFAISNTEMISYNEKNNKFGILYKNGKISMEQGIFLSITLKVKEDANVGDTNIALTNVSASNGSGSVRFPTASTKVFVSRDAKEGEAIPSNKENEIKEDAEEKIQVFTHAPLFALCILLFILLLIPFLTTGFKYLKNKEDKKLFYSLFGLEIILLGVLCGLFFFQNQKKDTNQDGIKDYEDAKEIIDYLIDMEGTRNLSDTPSTNDSSGVTTSNTSPSKNPSDFDVNGDGKVDIEDVGDIVEDVNDKTKVVLHEERLEEEYYVQRGEITLKFKAEISPKDAKITQVKINNQYYNVTYMNDTYVLKITTPDESGVCDFTITEVLVDNGKSVKTTLKMTREVLKEEPYINRFNLDDENGTLSFYLVDPDHAFIDGMATLYLDDQIISTGRVQNEKTTISFDSKLDQTYEIQITGNYDLDSESHDDKNHFSNESMMSQNFTLGGDYHFTLTEYAITDAIKEGETPIISFKSTNIRNATVVNAEVKIEDKAKEYNISKKDNDYYEVALNGADTSPGKHTVLLNHVGLDSLKTFYNGEDYQTHALTYTVLKDAPSVEDLTLSDDKEQQSIHAHFKFSDPNLATTKLTVVLVDSNGKIISSEEIDPKEKEFVDVNLSYQKNFDGFYTVKVLADYELSSKYRYTNTSLDEKTILTHNEDDIYISSMTIVGENYYPVKGQKNYKIDFTVHVGDTVKAIAKKYGNNNNYNKLSIITINGLNYSVDTYKESTTTDYKVSANLIIPNESGLFDIKANRVQLAITGYYNMNKADMFSVEEKKLTVDVLKDKPKIDHLIITDDYSKNTATFDFDVVLDSNEKPENFKDGMIQLQDQSEKIVAGHNTVIFKDFEKDKNFDLIFKGSYDLDTDTIDVFGTKNEVKDEEILKIPYGLYSEETYQNFKIKNGVVLSEKGNSYFEKNEQIKLYFDLDGDLQLFDATLDQVVLNEKEYKVTEVGTGYELILDGYFSSGEKELHLTDLILSNGKKITLRESYTFKPEVLKDVVLSNDFTYEEINSQVHVHLDLKDVDHSLVGTPKVLITDENGNLVYEGDYKKEIIFKSSKDQVRYFVQIIGDYDRDIDKTKNSEHYVENAILLDEVISFETNDIELKEIIDVNLYQLTDSEKILLVDEVNVNEMSQNLDSYFVEVMMEEMPTFRSKIKEIRNVDGRLILILDSTYLTDEKNGETLRIDFGRIKENNHAKNETHPIEAFKVLIEELKENGVVTLTRDYNASGVEVDGNTYLEEFTGTLNGNGHTIKNLSKPLFGKIQNGTVENLKLKDITMPTQNAQGTIAPIATNSTFKNILVDGYSKTSSTEGGVGVLLGSATGSTIENCRVTNFIITSPHANYQQIGGLVGSTTDTDIKNCYVDGSIRGGWNFRAGLVGRSSGGTFENNYTHVYLDAGWQRGNICGFSCGGANATFKNNVSFSYGVIDSAFFQGFKESENNYFVGDMNSQTGVDPISNEDVNDEFFSETLNFDSEYWRIQNTSIENLPTLRIEKSLGETNHLDYDEDKENLYANLVKLMPYYDSDKIIELAKNVTDESLLNDKITHMVPVDKSGNIVTYLTTDDAKKIDKLKIVFKTGTKAEYHLIFNKVYDMVATYLIPELNIQYNYNHYVIDANSKVVNNLTNYLKGLDYTNNLDILTTNDDSRIYRDFYNETTKNELRDFVLKYLSNSDYTNTSDDDIMNDYIESEIKKDKNLEKVLYVYNYFRRFYDLDIDGMKLYDFMMFQMQGFHDVLTPEKMTELYFGDLSGTNFNTNVTHTVYNNLLSGYTHLINMPVFLEYLVTHFSNHNMDEWVRSQFKGILVEIPVEGHEEDVQYTLWDHLSTVDDEHRDNYNVFNYTLPLLTLPETAAYLVSAPAQFTIGAQRVYMGNPLDPTELASFKEKMKVYTDRITSYYNTAYSILQDPKLFNDIHLYQIDKRTTKNENGTSVYNTPFSTNEPFHKNFDEVVNLWPAEYGVNAGNWGDRIEWNVAGFMDSNIKNDGNLDGGHPTWATWSHETAHYLDDRLFLKDYDRRYDAGGEDYADEFLMQKFSATGIVMNLSIYFKDQLEVATNLTPERINSKEKISDFYRKMFDSIYTLDYIEAMAYLKLSPEEQKALGVQISYPNESRKFATVDGESHDYNKEPEKFIGDTYSEDPYARFRARQVTQYQRLSDISYDFELKTIDDLIQNRIMLYTNLTGTTSRGSNSYGGEGINIVHWYQPNNPYGRPDSYSLKWFSYEMLGYKGYDDGFVEYASNIHYETRPTYTSLVKPKDEEGNPILTDVSFKSDDMAISTISDGVYQTIDEYKIDRFKQTEEKLKHIRFIDVDSYAKKMYDALVEDAKNNDKAYTKSFNVRKEIYYILKNQTNDFREDIFDEEIEQEITFNTEMFKDSSSKE